MKKRKSPCIDICDFSGQNGWCLGCGRTLNECDKWKKLRPYDIKIIQKQLEKRRSLIGEHVVELS